MHQTIALPPTLPIVEGYLKNRPLFFTLIRPQEAALFRATERYLTSPVLDLGCGDGFFARLVFGVGRIDVGLDLDDSRIEEARATGVYRSLQTYDGVRIPFEDGHFGSAVSNCVLEHVSDLDGVVRDVSRVVHPNGYFLTSVMTDRWEQYMLGARLLGDPYRRFMRSRQQHLNLLTRPQWDNVFERAGFAVEARFGYLSARTSAYLDAMHYVSVASIPTRILTGRWVFLPEVWARLAPLLDRAIDPPVDPDQSSAIFYVLRKQKE